MFRDRATPNSSHFSNCECPICSLVERLIEDIPRLQNVCNVIGSPIVNGEEWRPQNASGDWVRPNPGNALTQAGANLLDNAAHTGTDDEENNLAHAKGSGLYIIHLDSWIADGRFC